MRIKITFMSDRSGAVDFNYQHQIQAIIYKFLNNSDPDYATWLHAQGYTYRREQNFKFFVYSGIDFHKPIAAGRNGFSFKASPVEPFTLSFQIASPVNKFVQHLVEGIFAEGQLVKFGNQTMCVRRVETLAEPIANEIVYVRDLHLKPLESPIFVKKPASGENRDTYMFPDDDGYENMLNQNLVRKYETLHGLPYHGDLLDFSFHSNCKKPIKSFKVYKSGKVVDEIKGSLQPFTVSGPSSLVKIGLDCGFGQNNSMGCGYVEVEFPVAK